MTDEDGYLCSCHRHMGNEFFFLPPGACIYGSCDQKPIEHEPDDWDDKTAGGCLIALGLSVMSLTLVILMLAYTWKDWGW